MRAPSSAPLETAVQRDVIRLYERLGCVVAPVAQSYRRGSRRNPGTTGMPDLYVFPPVRFGPGVLLAPVSHPFWHETKRPGGKQRPGQIEWEQRCRARGVGYVLGGVTEALAHLRGLGLIR